MGIIDKGIKKRKTEKKKKVKFIWIVEQAFEALVQSLVTK